MTYAWAVPSGALSVSISKSSHLQSKGADQARNMGYDHGVDGHFVGELKAIRLKTIRVSEFNSFQNENQFT
jgi:hypothetical protein